ncbi:(2E,6E)-farnesyl diphosphate synthase [Orbaceae bacterium ESL0721]|nr:(2E,6E)-farnesyl diphosphate synthase [Orbaceae bacterium ESL0721]
MMSHTNLPNAPLLPDFKARIELLLAEYSAEIPDSTLKEAMRYSLLAGGKRIRPLLVYVTGLLFNCEISKLDIPAAAIEMIHTYSLIHDDLPAMDDDDLRRGKPTCHIKFNDAQAILAGDALQSLAFSLLAKSEQLTDNSKIAMIAELANASGVYGMCLGQSLDLEAEHKQVDLEYLQKIHRHKTGDIIQSAVRLGAIASGEIAKPYYGALDDYAKAIGLAFQIQDDILDVVGEQTIMGKQQGSDEAHEKSTYPALLGLAKARNMTEKLYQQAIDSLAKIPYNSQLLQDIAGFIISRDS